MNYIPETGKNLTSLNVLLYILAGGAILYFGKVLFIPLSVAALISFILYPVCKWLEKKGAGKSMSIGIALMLVTVVLGSVIFLLFSQMLEFAGEWEILENKIINALNELSAYLSADFGIIAEKQVEIMKSVIEDSGKEAIPLLRSTANSFTALLFQLAMIPILTSLILYHRRLLINAITSAIPGEKREDIVEILTETIHAYYSFIKGMLVVYLIVGILNSIGLYFIGIPYPLMFGFIASILTFIPYVGIIIASLLPITIAWVTYDSAWYPFYVILIFTSVQLLEAYVIFPFAVGSRLKINSLAIIIAIVVGGIIWGAAGMILFVPFISILKLIADRTEKLKALSVLLGNGE